MTAYQNLTDHELVIPNVGIVSPRGTIETGLDLNSPNVQPITRISPILVYFSRSIAKEYSVTQKQLKLLSWNINGIRAAEKRGFSQWLQSCGADIVMLQETKASPEQLPDALCRPDGFHAE